MKMKIRNVLDDLFFTTVRIEAHPETAPGHRVFGTGFVVEREVPNSHSSMFLVTCRHVVEGGETGVIYFMEGESGEPMLTIYPAELNHFQLAWVPHPNPHIDVSVMRLDPLLVQIFDAENKKLFVRFLREKDFLAKEALHDFNSIDDLLFIGYPAGIYDRRNGLPLARRAVTASPMFIDYEGEPLFVIDGKVRGGSSGSPVFAATMGPTIKADGTVLGRRTRFVGMVVEMLCDPYHKLHTEVSDPTLDLGVVYRPETVIQTLDEWFRHAGRNAATSERDRLRLL